MLYPAGRRAFGPSRAVSSAVSGRGPGERRGGGRPAHPGNRSMTQVRPRRSVLYRPGSTARAQEKAKTLPCDGIIFDLEDATAPDAKAAARETVCQSVQGGGYGGRELIVRVNGLDTPWGRDDVAAAAKAGPDAILLPKVERAEQVTELEGLMLQHGAPARSEERRVGKA